MKPYTLHRGDCLAVMRTMADNSVDSVVCDPPYELGFMGKSWDSTGIAYNVDMWREALRVLKPGGHLLAFSGSRTYHRMACAIEDAGFDIRDQIMWVYGSGFPKSLDVSKAIDKTAGAEREVTRAGQIKAPEDAGKFDSATSSVRERRDDPATDAARQWNGWGTALKPAHEPICVARKPLIGTVAANVLAHGTGALNIGACRVSTDENLGGGAYSEGAAKRGDVWVSQRAGDENCMRNGAAGAYVQPAGRWPANVIHDGSAAVLALFPAQAGASAPVRGTEASAASVGRVTGERERVAGAFHADTGSAARFFYCAKASRTDRNEGLVSSAAPAVANGATMRDNEDADWSTRNGNYHPTVKPTDLIAYLCRLVTPPGGKVLDMFFGSGSTGKACMREGFEFVGIDKDEDENGKPLGYLEIAEARIAFELARVTAANAPPPLAPQMDLFAGEADAA